MSNRKDSVSFSLDSSKHTMVKTIAKKERRSLSQMLQIIVDEYLEKQEVA